jgi:glutathione S-transferase
LFVLQNPGTVAPVAGTTDRYLVIQHLNYIASEVHPNIGGLFYPGQADAVVAAKKAAASEKLQYLTWVLKGKNFLLGDKVVRLDPDLKCIASFLN